VILHIEELVSKVLGEFYIDGKAHIGLDADVAFADSPPYFQFSNLGVAGGIGIEGGYRYELPVVEIKVWAGADGSVKFIRMGPIGWPPIDFNDFNFDGLAGSPVHGGLHQHGVPPFISARPGREARPPACSLPRGARNTDSRVQSTMGLNAGSRLGEELLCPVGHLPCRLTGDREKRTLPPGNLSRKTDHYPYGQQYAGSRERSIFARIQLARADEVAKWLQAQLDGAMARGWRTITLIPW